MSASKLNPIGYRTHLYVAAVVGLSALTLAAVLIVTALRPDGDNASIITTIIGVTAPASLAFVGLAVKEVYLSTNSRLTELVELTAKSNFAAGKLDRGYRKSDD